jgi:hypothetical protein
MTSGRQEISIVCDAEPEYNQPKLTLKFIVKANKNGFNEIQQGFATILNRQQKNLKEYPVSDTGIYIYFSGSIEQKNDKIVSLLIKENGLTGLEEEEQGQVELLEFLELTQDEEAIQTYRCLAFYWTSIQSGLTFINGGLNFEKVEDKDLSDTEDDTDDTDDYSEFE